MRSPPFGAAGNLRMPFDSNLKASMEKPAGETGTTTRRAAVGEALIQSTFTTWLSTSCLNLNGTQSLSHPSKPVHRNLCRIRRSPLSNTHKRHHSKPKTGATKALHRSDGCRFALVTVHHSLSLRVRAKFVLRTARVAMWPCIRTKTRSTFIFPGLRRGASVSGYKSLREGGRQGYAFDTRR
jgi:hypothetical protein